MQSLGGCLLGNVLLVLVLIRGARPASCSSGGPDQGRDIIKINEEAVLVEGPGDHTQAGRRAGG